MKDKNTYYREYMLKRYHDRMNKAREKLGGKCCQCGEINNLQIDHIEKDKKFFTLAKFWSCKLERFLQELSKCQLLCVKCHEIKTLNDLNQKSAKNTHGTLSSYRYCKCKICKKAKNDYMREWRKNNI